MRPKRAIFPIALACSLCLHAIGMNLYVRYGGYFIQQVKRPSAKPSPELVVKVDPEMLDFGESAGTGTGLNRSEGDQPIQARQADADQALLSREPVGSGKHANIAADSPNSPGGGTPIPPTPPVVPPTTPEKPQPDTTTPPAPITAPDHVAPPEPNPQVQVSPKEPDVKPLISQTPPDKPALTSPPQPQAQHVQVAVAPPTPPQDSKPGAPSSAGLPLPPSDSDSDPFSRVSGSMVFRNGRLIAQRGRKVKTVRPQIGIAGEVDALGMISAVVVVEVHINPEGEVTQVEIFKRSGSVAIDERTRDAVYHWVFEPTYDKAGHPIRDVLYFAIEYR